MWTRWSSSGGGSATPKGDWANSCANGGRLKAHGVQQRDVSAPVAGYAEHGVVGAVAGREEAGPRHVVVTRAQDEGIVGKLPPETVQYGGEALDVLESAHRAVHVRCVKQLQGEGRLVRDAPAGFLVRSLDSGVSTGDRTWVDSGGPPRIAREDRGNQNGRRDGQ